MRKAFTALIVVAITCVIGVAIATATVNVSQSAILTANQADQSVNPALQATNANHYGQYIDKENVSELVVIVAEQRQIESLNVAAIALVADNRHPALTSSEVLITDSWAKRNSQASTFQANVQTVIRV